MKLRLIGFMALTVLMCSICHQKLNAESPKANPKDLEAIAKSADAFVEAFHSGNVKALVASWTVDGDYTDQTGKHLKGHEELTKAFQGFFAENKGFKLRIESDSLRFVTPEVAIEDGVTYVIPKDNGPPSRARYTNVHVKKDGVWLLSSVRESPYSPPSNQEHFKGLEWAIGDWVEDSEKGESLRISYSFTPSQNFIVSSFTSTFKNISVGGGTQWIGFDPTTKQIRSWTFETDGGFAEGVWTQDGDKWTIKTQGVFRDGRKVTATNILTRIDADTVSWQSKDRTIDGKPVPDIKLTKIKRVK